MNKGRGSAQRCPVPWETIKLELNSIYRKSNSGTEKQQQQQQNRLVRERYKIKLNQESYREGMASKGIC